MIFPERPQTFMELQVLIIDMCNEITDDMCHRVINDLRIYFQEVTGRDYGYNILNMRYTEYYLYAHSQHLAF